MVVVKDGSCSVSLDSSLAVVDEIKLKEEDIGLFSAGAVISALFVEDDDNGFVLSFVSVVDDMKLNPDNAFVVVVVEEDSTFSSSFFVVSLSSLASSSLPSSPLPPLMNENPDPVAVPVEVKVEVPEASNWVELLVFSLVDDVEGDMKLKPDDVVGASVAVDEDVVVVVVFVAAVRKENPLVDVGAATLVSVAIPAPDSVFDCCCSSFLGAPFISSPPNIFKNQFNIMLEVTFV